MSHAGGRVPRPKTPPRAARKRPDKPPQPKTRPESRIPVASRPTIRGTEKASRKDHIPRGFLKCSYCEESGFVSKECPQCRGFGFTAQESPDACD